MQGSVDYASPMANDALPSFGTGAIELPAVLDIEASGFGRDSYPVEIGFVLPDGEAFCTLIRPAPEWKHWDPKAEAVHHITLQTAIEHGRDVLEVATLLNERLYGKTLYCDGWAHDFVWLNVLFESAGLNPAFKLDNLRALLTDTQAALWGDLKLQVTAEMHLPRHRASSDAKILQLTLQRMQSTA
jgi:hypothetical protein